MSFLMMEKRRYECMRSRITDLQQGLEKDRDKSKKIDDEILRKVEELHAFVHEMVCMLDDEIDDNR